ncbi:uncharacterized protein LOC116135837 [Pistacia vera]|uniref:uncharacterized protein LOC116135837 n=1 Tax=Pistacia vera TaxID=55513 RepID=UPI001262B34A|nr:uncharacterized protein LOC116135837 [Pistacia vera]
MAIDKEVTSENISEVTTGQRITCSNSNHEVSESSSHSGSDGSGQGNDDYLTGTIVQPTEDAPIFKRWKAANSTEAAKQTYSDKEDTAESFEIEGILHDLHRGDLLVTQYYSRLNHYWQRLDLHETHEQNYSADATSFKKIVEKKQIYKFLLGLNKNLDEIRGRILGTKPLPNIREVVLEVHREESQKKVMLGTQNNQQITEGSALVVREQFSSSNDNCQRRGRPWCDHCKKPGHTKDTCWKIHGKPKNWKPRESRGHHVSVEDKPTYLNPSPFSKEQLEILQKLITQSTQGSSSSNSNSVLGSGSLA